MLLIAIFATRLAAARAVADAYVTSHHFAVRERSAEVSGEDVLVRYDQVVSGVRVYGGALNIYVRASKARIAFNGLRPEPHADVHPKVAKREAAAIARRRTPVADRVRYSQPELVIVPRASFDSNLPSTDRLAWQVDVSPPYDHSLFIDALTGQLLYDASREPSIIPHR